MENRTADNWVKKFLIPIAGSIVASVAVGIGSAFLTTFIMVGQLDTRVRNLEDLPARLNHLEKRIPPLEVQINRHEGALEKDFARHEQVVSHIATKTDDQEKRLTRLEAQFGEMQSLLTEIRSDVKILLRGGQQ